MAMFGWIWSLNTLSIALVEHVKLSHQYIITICFIIILSHQTIKHTTMLFNSKKCKKIINKISFKNQEIIQYAFNYIYQHLNCGVQKRKSKVKFGSKGSPKSFYSKGGRTGQKRVKLSLIIIVGLASRTTANNNAISCTTISANDK